MKVLWFHFRDPSIEEVKDLAARDFEISGRNQEQLYGAPHDQPAVARVFSKLCDQLREQDIEAVVGHMEPEFLFACLCSQNRPIVQPRRVIPVYMPQTKGVRGAGEHIRFVPVQMIVC
jgi:hypothetical protein